MSRVWSCCGTTYVHNDRVGCCSGCGRVFASLGAFERHQREPRDERGRLTCLDPATATRTTKAGEVLPIFQASHRSREGQKPLWQQWSSPEDRAAWVESFKRAAGKAEQAEFG